MTSAVRDVSLRKRLSRIGSQYLLYEKCQDSRHSCGVLEHALVKGIEWRIADAREICDGD